MAKAAVLKTAVARATSGFESLALRCRPALLAAVRPWSLHHRPRPARPVPSGEMAERLKAPVC